MAVDMTLHPPGIQHMPQFASWDYARLRESIQRYGVLIPAFVDENGAVIDGHHRAQICEELGIELPTQLIESGLDEREVTNRYVIHLNTFRRHLTPRERRAVIRWYVWLNPELSNRAIAKELAVDDHTVAAIREDLEGRAEIPHVHQPDTRNEFKNKYDSPESEEIFDDRTPVNAANHRNECAVEIIYHYPAPPDEPRVRAGDPIDLPYVRETERSEYSSGMLALTAKAPRNVREARTAATEVGDRLFQAWCERGPLTMDRESATWR